MSSRYMLDFAPAFAVAIRVLIQLVGQRVRLNFKARYASRINAALLLTLGVWWAYQVSTASIFRATGEGVGETLVLERAAGTSQSLLDQADYTASTDFSSSGVPFNGYGWQSSGRTGAMLVLFLRAARARGARIEACRRCSSDAKVIGIKIRVRIGNSIPSSWRAVCKSTNGRRVDV